MLNSHKISAKEESSYIDLTKPGAHSNMKLVPLIAFSIAPFYCYTISSGPVFFPSVIYFIKLINSLFSCGAPYIKEVIFLIVAVKLPKVYGPSVFLLAGIFPSNLFLGFQKRKKNSILFTVHFLKNIINIII